MPRNYRRKLGARSDEDYIADEIQAALRMTEEGMGERFVSEITGIPRGTLQNKRIVKHPKSPGLFYHQIWRKK